jgi:hypothetical protein
MAHRGRYRLGHFFPEYGMKIEEIEEIEDLEIRIDPIHFSPCTCRREFSESPPDFSLLFQFPVNIRGVTNSGLHVVPGH